MRRYSVANIRHSEADKLKELSARDQRPPWLLIKDALSYYEKIHQKPRPTPIDLPKRGRPKTK